MKSLLKRIVILQVLVFTLCGCVSPLINAASEGDIAATQQLIREGVNVNEPRNSNGESALVVASMNGKIDIVRTLIQAGADVDLRTKYNDTALSLASWKCQSNIIELLLNNRAEPNVQNTTYGSTPLMLLVSYCNDTKSVKALLRKGARVDSKNNDGDTALMTAASKGHAAIVSILLDNGANVNLGGWSDQTALYLAAEKGHTEIVDMLLARGADSNVKVKGGCVSTARRCRPVPGWTALMIAAAEGYSDAVDRLLGKGASPNLQNSYGRTALMYASHYGFSKIVDSLLAKGADPNIIPTDEQGMPALTAAVDRNNKSIVEALLKNGANINARMKDGTTALYWAKKQGYSELQKILADAGALE